MRTARSLGPLALSVVAVAALFVAGRYELWSFGSPGAGLMPVLAAGLLLATTLLALRVPAGSGAEEDEAPDNGRVMRYVIALVLLPLLILAVGMLPALGLFVLVMLRIAERARWWTAVAVAAASVALSWLLFVRLLGVPLPGSSLFPGTW
jgi:putative tricarboxylic transport membrane protein